MPRPAPGCWSTFTLRRSLEAYRNVYEGLAKPAEQTAPPRHLRGQTKGRVPVPEKRTRPGVAPVPRQRARKGMAAVPRRDPGVRPAWPPLPPVPVTAVVDETVETTGTDETTVLPRTPHAPAGSDETTLLPRLTFDSDDTTKLDGEAR
ncbi:hypothetical protein [Catenuloplanes niger]